MDHQAFKQSASGADTGRRPRIAFLDILKPQELSFLRDIIAYLAPDHDIRFLHSRNERELLEAIAWADIVWLEWCLEHAVWATNRVDMRAQAKKVIVRLHSTEVIDGRFPHQVKWEAVDHLIFVSEDIRDELFKQLPDLPKHVSHSVISNGIDCNRFAPGPDAGDPFRIAWVGDVAMKKNPMLALQILRRLVDIDPRYHLHVAGEVSCARTARYLDHLIGAMDLSRSISFYGRVADIEHWYRDKGVLLSTTLYESFGMNIGEAMASGCWPVVHDYPGAAKTWPQDALFASVDQAVARILQAQSNAYRSFVVERYSVSRQERAVRGLLGALDRSAAFDPRAYWEQRHVSFKGSIRSVGHIGLSDGQNQADYAANAERLRGALLEKFPEPNGKLLLDAGCGIGLVSALCAALGFDVIGVDFSETAIGEARIRVPNGTFIAGAFDQVAVPPVDVAICMDVFFHIVDDELWARGLKALASALRPGGRLLVLEHFPDTPSAARHVRWRSLDAYRNAAAVLGLTLSAVDTYHLQQIGADKTLLVFDKAVAEVAMKAPALAPEAGDNFAPMMLAN
ncbi:MULTISPECIES: glycosyltransferase [unclassified Bradyrhizobium]|uniref:glycosyltransferase n=2 Tax=unclassified Bradyrhizobium TaxID=2631580 RepID=UPI0028E3CB50|nr:MULTISPECIES: glycosyltransferase [unclassified Bradyrhizobium]